MSGGMPPKIPASDVRNWTCDRVLDWLQELELSQYIPTFADNDLDGEALLLLNDAALRDLDITSIGHRMLLLSEIFQLKELNHIPIEPGDWVPQGYYDEPIPDNLSRALCERDDRIRQLEVHVAQMNTEIMHLREDVMALARATGKPDAVHQTAWVNAQAPLMPMNSNAYALPSTSASPSSPTRFSAVRAPTPPSDTLTPEPTPPSLVQRKSEPAESSNPPRTLADASPIFDAVARMLRARGCIEPYPIGPEHPVFMDDPASVVLRAALERYQVREDWRAYALFCTSGELERCIAYDEKPLALYANAREQGQPMTFAVRAAREIESPEVVAQRKFAARRSELYTNKPVPMRSRASELPGVCAVNTWQRQLESVGANVEEALRLAVVHGPASQAPLPPMSKVTFAVAIYPYESDRDDEFDIQAGDTFIVLSKTKGWWTLRRDSLADGHGDVYLPDCEQVGFRGARAELWTGWVPAGCLLETTRPLGVLTDVTSSASSLAASFAGIALTSPGGLRRIDLARLPIPLTMVTQSGTAGMLCTDFHAPDGSMQLSAGERLRVFKRYNYWSYCIVEGPTPARGWIPSWLISKRPTSSSSVRSVGADGPSRSSSQLRAFNGTSLPLSGILHNSS